MNKGIRVFTVLVWDDVSTLLAQHFCKLFGSWLAGAEFPAGFESHESDFLQSMTLSCMRAHWGLFADTVILHFLLHACLIKVFLGIWELMITQR